MKSLAAALVVFLLGVPIAVAQSDRGTITGTVTDPAGAVIPGAVLAARNTETGAQFETVTTATGNYTLSQLPAGLYEIGATASGFGKFLQQGIRVQVAQTARIDILLQVGATSESVTVSADAPLLKTESAEQSHNIGISRFNDLPLYGPRGGGAGLRYPWAFTNIMPGATIVPAGGNNSIRVNGIQNDSFGVRIDGQEATFTQQPNFSPGSQPSVEALEEVSLQTSNFAAEYGQVGGGLFNFTSRSGTNKLHGSAFEYLRNEFMNAAQPFTNVKPLARSHNYGGSFGGPVYIPRVYDGRNRTFFFQSFEQAYNSSNTVNRQTLPTAAYRQGDFSAALTNRQLNTDPLGRPILENTIYDPLTSQVVNNLVVRNPFPGNIIPQARFDPVAAKIQAMMPQPDNGNLVNNWTQNFNSFSRATIITTKVDHSFSSISKISAYVSLRLNNSPYNNADGLPRPLTGSRAGAIYTPTIRVNYDHSLTPTLLLHLGAGFIRHMQQDKAVPGVLEYDAQKELGLYAGAITDFTGVTSPGFPRITGLNHAQGGLSLNMGPANANYYYMEKPTGVASATWVRGSHTMKIGADWRKDAHTDRNVRGSQGIFNFGSTETGLPSTNGQNLSGGNVGFPYASFLLGLVNSASVNAPQDPQVRKTAWALFVQDNWKITRTLTLDYGLRWDYQTALRELWDRQSSFSGLVQNPSAGGLPGGFVYEGSGPGRCNCALTRSYPYAVQPRLGLAYQITPRTVLRAGWGLSYGATPNFGYITNQPYVGVGFNQLVFNSPSFGDPAVTLRGGLPYQQSELYRVTLDPGARPAPGSIDTVPYWLDPNGGRPGRVNQWNISLQREFAKNLAVEAAYVGNRGVWFQANSLNDLNALTPERIRQAGLDLNLAADRTLLTSRLDSALAQSRGFRAPYAGYPLSATVGQSLRPFPQFTTIPVRWSPLGNSWYDSLQVKVTKRISRGLDFLSAFTWQKELQLGADGGPINDVFNRANQKSISASSLPLVFVTSFTYQTPQIGNNALLRNLTGGWAIGGILRYQSGSPIQVPGAQNALASQLFRGTFANRVSGVPLFLKDLNCRCFDPSKEFVLNPAAWSDPVGGQWGTAAAYYNDYRTARRPSEQLTLSRFFRIREGMRLEFRAMFYNVFNRIYLNNPDSTNARATPSVNQSSGMVVSGFGRINTGSTFSGPRDGTLEARWQF